VATIAQSLPASAGRFAWFWQFLKEEMVPYRGRGALVARMVTASTLIMILCMTFKIPEGAYAALYGLVLSRESLERTTSEARTMVIGMVLGGAYVVAGAMLVLGDPMLRFLWVVGTLFLIFYATSALSNYTAVARFGYLIVITIALWDSHLSAESKVESTLWAVGAITIGSIITLLLELIFAALRRADVLVEGITERLVAVEQTLAQYAGGGIESTTQATVTRLALVGASRLRRRLERSNYDPAYKQHMGAIVALTTRLVDLAANLAQFSGSFAENERERIRRVAHSLAEMHAGLAHGTAAHMAEFLGEGGTPSGTPLLGEIEKTVSLLSSVFTDAHLPGVYGPPPSEDRPPKMFITAKLFDPEHIRFGLRGCLAASLCYLIYNGVDWPGISTSVTTCFLTALTTVGASHQKQFLRFAGAIVGGFGIGMGAQVFILPYLDSIGAFTVLFVVVAIVAAWLATSSARLSYFGVQVAVAFYLINLQEFKIQTSLAVARDRVVGILLGLFMMWLAFDRLWGAPAGTEMKRTFLSALRLLALLAREPVSADLRVAVERSYALRERIHTQFNKVRSLADGALFEFGPSRQQDLAFRDCIRRWQPQLRSLFLMRITLLKYRLRLTGFELPQAVAAAQAEFDEQLARVLDGMANRIEGEEAARTRNLEDSLEHLDQTVGACGQEEPQKGKLETFLALSRKIQNVAESLDNDVYRI
jgi:multidrug resistance protein MdtO